MNSYRNLDLLDVITIFSVLLQIASYEENIQQSSNDDLMTELQKQNKEYFEKIIDNQNKILEKLAKLG